MLLLGKEDVFNHDPIDKTQVEGEMLSSTKISFIIRFSTAVKDVSVDIYDGSKEAEISHAKIHFKSGVLADTKTGDAKKKILHDM